MYVRGDGERGAASGERAPRERWRFCARPRTSLSSPGVLWPRCVRDCRARWPLADAGHAGSRIGPGNPECRDGSPSGCDCGYGTQDQRRTATRTKSHSPRARNEDPSIACLGPNLRSDRAGAVVRTRQPQGGVGPRDPPQRRPQPHAPPRTVNSRLSTEPERRRVERPDFGSTPTAGDSGERLRRQRRGRSSDEATTVSSGVRVITGGSRSRARPLWGEGNERRHRPGCPGFSRRQVSPFVSALNPPIGGEIATPQAAAPAAFPVSASKSSSFWSGTANASVRPGSSCASSGSFATISASPSRRYASCSSPRY
jgi:hypothetical protein